MSHACPECGMEHGAEVDALTIEPEVAEVAGEAAVKIAEIEANRDITLAKVAVKAEDSADAARIAELEGRLRGIEETLDRIAPPAPSAETMPEPEVMLMDPPAPEPEVSETPVEPPPIVDTPAPKAKRRNAFWG